MGFWTTTTCTIEHCFARLRLAVVWMASLFHPVMFFLAMVFPMILCNRMVDDLPACDPLANGLLIGDSLTGNRLVDNSKVLIVMGNGLKPSQH